MTTIRQVEANRRNAQKSTGPRTARGKLAVRFNAMEHGLACSGHALPDPGLDPGLAAERARWHADLRPEGCIEEALVDQMVLSRMQMIRVPALAHTLRAREADRATVVWHADRAVDAEHLARRIAAQPGPVAARLRTSAAGCRWLIERWEALGRALDLDVEAIGAGPSEGDGPEAEGHADGEGDDAAGTADRDDDAAAAIEDDARAAAGRLRPGGGGAWTDAQRDLALDLLGVPPELRTPGVTPLDGATAEATARLRREAVAFELIRLRGQLEDGLDDLDEIERSHAEHGLAVEFSPEMRLLRRYALDWSRRWWRTWDELRGRRRDLTFRPRPRPGRVAAPDDPDDDPESDACTDAQPGEDDATLVADRPRPGSSIGGLADWGELDALDMLDALGFDEDDEPAIEDDATLERRLRAALEAGRAAGLGLDADRDWDWDRDPDRDRGASSAGPPSTSASAPPPPAPAFEAPRAEAFDVAAAPAPAAEDAPADASIAAIDPPALEPAPAPRLRGNRESRKKREHQRRVGETRRQSEQRRRERRQRKQGPPQGGAGS